MIQVKRLSLKLERAQILNDINFTAPPGELVAILGSNGAGKSTLMKCLAGLQAADSGSIEIGGQPLASMNATERAKNLSYLPQQRPIAWPICVEDVVALGRYAYGVHPGRLSATDQQIVDAMLASCNLNHLKHRPIDTLSGGEQARVHCARTFAAQAPLVLADEPTASLDPKHELEIMMLLKGYVGKSSTGIVVSHDPALAARFASRLIWLKCGMIVADGTAKETLTPELLGEVYEVEAEVSFAGAYPSINIHKPL
jgi:iron complex transport system ATP-binding protein